MKKRLKKKIEKRKLEKVARKTAEIEKAFETICEFLIEKDCTSTFIFGDCMGYNPEDDTFNYKFQMGGYETPLLLTSDKLFKKRNMWKDNPTEEKF